MSPTIFLTGATGFVGGQLLHSLLELSPTPQITALVRKPSQAEKLQTTYGLSLKTALGDLDNHDVLVYQASEADIIIQSADDQNEGGMRAILQGVARGTRMAAEENSRPQPILIQISGTASLIDPAFIHGGLDPKVYSDRDDIAALKALPKTRLHVTVERLLYSLAEKEGVKLVTLAPGSILGQSQSLFRKESLPAMLAEEMIKYGQVVVLGEGANRWGWVSSQDLARAVCLILAEALKVQSGERSALEFGKNGYYFVGAGEASRLQKSEHAARRLFAAGKIRSAEVAKLRPEDVVKFSDNPIFGAILGSNSRFRSDKLAALGWKPVDVDWRPLMEEGNGERL